MRTITKVFIGIAVIASVGAYITALNRKVQRLTAERETLKNNQELLIQSNNAIEAECRKYKVADSLNAYKISDLRLRLDEYKRYRAEDMKMIDRLKLDKSEMQKVIDAQTNTIYDLSTTVKDSVVAGDTVKSFDYRSKWVDVAGQIWLPEDRVELTIHTREELMVVESVSYRRFLGFLWKTKNVKSRDVDVVSKNPHTKIEDVDFVSIEKR